MGQIMKTFVIVAALLGLMFVPPVAAAPSRKVVVLELFTSQGCSSCPPADRILSALGKGKGDPGGVVVPLAFHVDYWNSIGWKDPFSSSQWSNRQRAYAGAWSSSQVYTPQLVLNGRTHVVGSSEQRIRQEIARQLAVKSSGSVAIRSVRQVGSELMIALDASLDDALRGRTADVFVVVFENGVTTAVTRGENSGKKLVNDHIVRSMSKALTLAGGEAAANRSLTVPVAGGWNSKRLGVAVLIQDTQSLAIHGADVLTMEAR